MWVSTEAVSMSINALDTNSGYMCFGLCHVVFSMFVLVFFLMIRRPPRSTLDRSSAASDVYKRQQFGNVTTTAPMWGNSSYHGVNFKYEKRFSDGLNLLANYTFSKFIDCLLYTSPSPRDRTRSRMPSSAWKQKKQKQKSISLYDTKNTYTN